MVPNLFSIASFYKHVLQEDWLLFQPDGNHLSWKTFAKLVFVERSNEYKQ